MSDPPSSPPSSETRTLKLEEKAQDVTQGVASPVESAGQGPNPPPMSKNAQKRARREAARLAGREEWKAKMKEKRREQKARRKEAIAAGLIAPPTPTRFRPMKQAWSRVRAIIDLDFPDDLMNPKVREKETHGWDPILAIPLILDIFLSRKFHHYVVR